jgi:flagellar biosynthesis/type III secretory pathway protein FliH
MCNLGQALLDEGIEIGIAKGFQEGFQEGFQKSFQKGIKIARLGSVKNARKELGCTWERAMAVVGVPENEYAEYKEMLKNEGLALT